MRTSVLEYAGAMQRATGLLRPAEIEGAVRLIDLARSNGRGVFVFGNGGSASTASHLAVDLGRFAVRDGERRHRIMSLTDNSAWVTAIANDCGYANAYSDQLRNFLEPGDLVIGISASGDSENMVRAFEYARDVHATRLALIGFDGGRMARLATRRVWIHSHDYGIVESMHLFVCHMIVTLLAKRQTQATSLPTLCGDEAPATSLPTLNGRLAATVTPGIG